MIPLDVLRAVRTIVTHANCADGTATALILHHALPDAEVVVLAHGSPELASFPAAPGQLWCDIAPPAARVAEFVEAGAIVLDHHKTARPVVEAFGERGVFADEEREPGVSGAVLAFREVWRHIEQDYVREITHANAVAVERLATLAGVRDTWQRDDSRWPEACAQAEALRFWPWEHWARLEPYSWPGLLKIGTVLLERKALDVDRAIRSARRFNVEILRVVCFQGVNETSDAAEKLGDEADLVVGFVYDWPAGQSAPETARVQFSLRSRGSFDCASFARMYGGGGHSRAAGFHCHGGNTGVMNPFFLIERLLSAHLAFESSLP